MRVIAAIVAAASVASSAQATVVQFQHLRTVNVAGTSNSANPYFIGANPSALAWNGSRLFVGGFSGAAGQTLGIVEVLDHTTNPGSPTFGTPFASRVQGAGGGYTGLELSPDGNSLFSSFDATTNQANSVQGWNVSNPLTPPASATWSQRPTGSPTAELFRGSGVSFDPGFGGGGVAAGGGVAYVAVNNGRVGRLDPTTGTILYTATTNQPPGSLNGFSYFVSPPNSSVVRSIDFNPNTGDAYLRVFNNLVRFNRTGANAGTALQIGDLTDSTNLGASLAMMAVPDIGNFVILNDRSVTTAGQSFLGNLRLFDTAGAAHTLDFGSFADFTSNAYMDFDYDPASQTLAVLNFSTGRVDIFYVVPAPGGAGLLGVAGLVAMRRKRR